MHIVIWTRCFVLGHKMGKPRKVRHHARTRSTCSRCGLEVMTMMPTTEADAEQRTLPLDPKAPLGGSTYKAKETPRPPAAAAPSEAELADHRDPPWVKPEGSDNDLHKP